MMRRRVFGALGLIFALGLLFTYPVKADELYPRYYFSTVYGGEVEYIDFGGVEFDRNSKQGFDIIVDYSSVSYQSVLITVIADPGVMEERQVSRFYVILPSGEIVDSFDAIYIDNLGVWRTYYYRNATLTDDYIGAATRLQVVAVSYDEVNDMEWIVGWTAPTPFIQFKPLPVKDYEANSWLEMIYYKLQQIYDKLLDLYNMLNSKLADLQKAVEDAYKPSEAHKQKLDQSIDRLMDKVPMNQMIDKVNDLNNTLQNKRSQLKQPGSQLKIGEQFYFIPPEMNYFTGRYGVNATIQTHIIDLTEFKEEVEMFRRIMQAALWVFFFHMLLNMLTPRPRV